MFSTTKRMKSPGARGIRNAALRTVTSGIVVGLVLFASVARAAERTDAASIEELWMLDCHMVMETAPVVADLDGDGDAEILIAAYENLIAVDGVAKELWRFDTRGRYMTWPAVLERGGAGPLIYAGDITGLFTCLSGAGEVMWQAETGPIYWSAPLVADLDGDGAFEVIQADKSGGVTAFDALTGNRFWQTKLDGGCASPAAGDLDGDGRLELVISTAAGKAFALDASGAVRWEFAMGGVSQDWAACSPILFGASQGKARIAVASSEQRIFCLDGDGRALWEWPTRGAIASSISAGDFDGDSRTDVFAVTQLGHLYRFDEDGRLLWDIDTQRRCLAPGAIADVNGDGALDYVLCAQNGNMLVFGQSGEILFNHQFDHRTINMTPAFGDIIPQRPGLEFAVTGGESGRVICLGTAAPAGAQIPWGSYRADIRSTGGWFGLAALDTVRMTAENLHWDQLLTGDDIVFRISNPRPDDAPLRAEASCLAPDSTVRMATGSVIGGHGALHLPLSITAPGIYTFSWKLVDPSGKTLAAGARELNVQPYANDRALAKRAVLALDEVTKNRDAVAGIKVALLEESRAIENGADRLAPLQAAAPGAAPAFLGELERHTAALNARAKRALALVEAARPIIADAPDTEVILFEGTTWENRDVDSQTPPSAVAPLHIKRRCVPGEHEPVSIKALNVTPNPLKVYARVEASADGPSVTIYEVRPVPTNQGAIAWDPMTPLGDGAVEVSPLMTRELWLDIDLTNAKPGAYSIPVTIDTGAWNTTAQIELNVLPFQMAGPGAMWLCCWARYSEYAIKDLLAHGNNVFTAPLPPAKYIEDERARIEIDFTELDKFLTHLEGHEVFLLMTGIPSLGTPIEDSAYVPRLAAYLDEVIAHIAAHSIDEERVAFYPYDEPGGAGWDTVNRYIAFARQGLKARPGLKFYVNGGGDLPMFEAFGEVASIWCPSYFMLPETSPVMRFIRDSGKTLWTYDCTYAYARPIGANTKTINVAAQYRMAAPYALHFGATGIGYWCYNVGPSMWQAVSDEYPLVYDNPDGTSATSRRWEAVRESMEDTRILAALREKLSDASAPPVAKAKIRRLLEESLPRLARQALEEARLGVPRYALDASHNDNTVNTFREELMDCVALLTAP